MNLFKILATGDGRINEPNVSAFLGYLLSPAADHGLKDEFLKRILVSLHKSSGNSNLENLFLNGKQLFRSLSTDSVFEIQVLLEQAFRAKEASRKQIVDIVILCFERTYQQKESIAKTLISQSNTRALKQIILIENKIKDSAVSHDQLYNQVISTSSELEHLLGEEQIKIENLLSLVFISPGEDNSKKEFENFVARPGIQIPSTHIAWKGSGDDNIVSFLKDILKEELDGSMDPVSDIMKHTLKSFVAFIETGFKSLIEEELEGEIKRDILFDFSVFKQKYNSEFNQEGWDKLERVFNDLQNYKNLIIRHSKTHPISVFYQSSLGRKKIFDISKDGSQLKIQLVNYNHEELKKNKIEFIRFLTNSGLKTVKEKEYGIEVKFDEFDPDLALQIFDRQYRSL